MRDQLERRKPINSLNMPTVDRLGNRYLEALGAHCILELYECPSHLLDDRHFVEKALREAAKVAESTLLSEVSHQFTPQGVTALVLLAESHISIHTWPEANYAAVDVFTCGEQTRPQEACEYLVQTFRAGNHLLLQLPRHKLSAAIANGEHYHI
ncbi:S-adenosylmethionine decarboxylase proenzyme [Thalassoporum mexicanum PCC 7367]|nr:adenosylmethionine decarboxylase [Pseudanabaena sp. PCC 7367]AFY70777.1 S-adenosylmethionine decarboxylase proenzyme [Pseudanabaena sp. PCC 7367]